MWAPRSWNCTIALAFTLALGACTTTDDEPRTGPGELTFAENTGGFCDHQRPWCGYEVTFNGTSFVVTSRSAAATGTGTLTAKGLADVAELIERIPYDAPDDAAECIDAPMIRMHIDFDEVGQRTFQYSCTEGVLQPLALYVKRIANAVINFENDDTVIVDAPF